MRREDCVEMFAKIPEGMHPQVNLILRNGFCLSVSMVARYEDNYVVFSGREGGTSDEGRGFFVPYDEISYVRIERAVRVGELKRMFGETGYEDMEDRLDAMTHAAQKEADNPSIDSDSRSRARGQRYAHHGVRSGRDRPPELARSHPGGPR